MIFLFLISSCNHDQEEIIQTNDYPKIYPDYVNVTIPYNIAPLNFKIMGDCQKVEVIMSGKKSSITLSGKYKISIPFKKWKRLLTEQKSDSIIVKVSALSGETRKKFKPFVFYISADPIDPYLSYRL
ncbi:MAG: hypothetical protein NTZ85_03740, partial [Bacteroidia bacterium]|nr:hypothetical protein [Bacteroidia bacterium]